MNMFVIFGTLIVNKSFKAHDFKNNVSTPIYKFEKFSERKECLCTDSCHVGRSSKKKAEVYKHNEV